MAPALGKVLGNDDDVDVDDADDDDNDDDDDDDDDDPYVHGPIQTTGPADP